MLSEELQNMNGRRKLTMILIAFALGLNLLLGLRVYSREANHGDEAEALRQLSVMMRVMMLIRQNYVDEDKTDYQSLIQNAVQGMVSQLDPHSSFLDPDDYRNLRETTEGQFGGIGIIVTMREGVLTVVSPIEDTPGSRAGLRAGDRIVEIDGESTQGMKLSQAVKMMKGEPGTEVRLQIVRRDDEETLDLTIVRAIVEVSSVKDSRMLDEKIGYLRITQFDETTANRLRDTLRELEEQDVQGLILDLRNNPGGLLSAAVDVASQFLRSGDLVVYTEGRHPSQDREYRAGRVARRSKVPLAILVNQGSASASEIVAGALRDNGRAVLVGEKTFGKGSVQGLIALPDESALRLTTAVYYTPGRQVIHEKGIEPDVVVELSRQQLREMAEAYREAAEEGRPVAVEDDPQLARALEVLRSHDTLKAARD